MKSQSFICEFKIKQENSKNLSKPKCGYCKVITTQTQRCQPTTKEIIGAVITPTSNAIGNGAPVLRLIIADAYAPIPENAACAKENCPANPVTMCSPNAEIE